MRRITILLSFAALAGCIVSSAHAQIKFSGTSQVSIGQGNTAPNGSSGDPSLSLNGRYIAFDSTAPNIVSNDSGFDSDVFLQDLKTGAVSRVSVNTAGVGGDDNSQDPSVSPTAPDGFFAVAFSSRASNLGSLSSASGNNDIYVRMPTLGITEIISTAPGFTASNGNSNNPSVTVLPSPDRVLIAFSSFANNLVSSDTNSRADIFLASFTAPKSTSYTPSSLVSISRISRALVSGQQSNGDSLTPKISGDGRFVVFVSQANNLTSAVSGTNKQIYLFDTQNGSTTLISKNSLGNGGNDDSFSPSISYSGRYIVYLTDSTDILSDSTGNTAVVRYDTRTGVTSRVNKNSAGIAGGGDATSAYISANGRFVGFTDSSSNLISNDLNGISDAFLKDMTTGDISRVSVSGSGAESSGVSDSAAISAKSYNSPIAFGSYRSFATDLVSGNTESGNGDIFLSQAALAFLPLSPSTRPEVPADVSVNRKNLTVTAEKFAGATAVSSAISGDTAKAEAAITLSVKYEFQIAPITSGGTRSAVIAKRNSITVRNLRPGTYTARYRAITVRNSDSRVLKRTPFSPKQRLTIKK